MDDLLSEEALDGLLQRNWSVIQLHRPVLVCLSIEGSTDLQIMLDMAWKDVMDVLKFRLPVITSVNHEDREADLAMLKEELAADLDELEAEKAEELSAVSEENDRLIAIAKGEREPEEGDVLDDETPVADRVKKIVKEETRDLSDLEEEYAERKQLLSEAFDTFQKLSPKMLINDETLYREMKVRYGTYFRGGMGAEAIEELLQRTDLDERVIDLSTSAASATGEAQVSLLEMLHSVLDYSEARHRPNWTLTRTIAVPPKSMRPEDADYLYAALVELNARVGASLHQGVPEIFLNAERGFIQVAAQMLLGHSRMSVEDMNDWIRAVHSSLPELDGPGDRLLNPTFRAHLGEFASTGAALHPDAHRSESKLAVALTHPEESVRAKAVQGFASSRGLVILRMALTDPSAEARVAAVQALGAIETEEAVSALAGAFGDPSSEVSAVATAELRSEYSKAALIRMLASGSAVDRLRSAKAVGVVLGESASEHLTEALKDEDGPVRRTAALALGDMGSIDAVESLGALILEGNDDVLLRRAAVYAIAQIVVPTRPGAASPATLPLMVAVNHDPDEHVRKLAFETLNSMGANLVGIHADENGDEHFEPST